MKLTSIRTLLASVATLVTLAALGLLSTGAFAQAAAPQHTGPTLTARAAKTTTVTTRHTKLGTFLIGPNGHTLYLWKADKRGSGRSVCTGSCASVWPPLMLTGKLKAAGGVKAKLLGSIARKGGRQVTYNGWPLYFYVTDSKAGQTTGEGSGSFGAPWYVLSTKGSAITG